MALLVTLAGCGANTSPTPAVTPQNVSGVYDSVVPNFDGRGDARVGFSFDQKVAALTGAVRILPPIASPWQKRRYKALFSIDSYTTDALGVHVSGHVAFGGDIGTFNFGGTIFGGTFSFHYSDAVGKGEGTAFLSGPYIEPGTAVSAITPMGLGLFGTVYVGSYTVNLGSVAAYSFYHGAFNGALCPVVNANGVTTFPMTITSAAPDGFGGVGFTGEFGGPLSYYVPEPPPYPFKDEAFPGSLDVAEVWGSWTTIQKVYDGTSGYFAFQLQINDWSPPETARQGQWIFYLLDDLECQGQGAFTSITGDSASITAP